MDDKSALLEVSASNDEAKRNGQDLGNRQETGDLSMPICFLVKEQAKSHVAIQDLQKRVESIENVQIDVIDSLAEIRKFLCSESNTYSNLTESLNNATVDELPSSSTKFGPFSKFTKPFYSPTKKEVKSALAKECGPSMIQVPVNSSQKQFDSKSKESALDSDKQDSGLDSDHLSLNKPSINWPKQESADELLLLLDEISDRTEVLQKQLSFIDLKSEVIVDNPGPSQVTKEPNTNLSAAVEKDNETLYATCVDFSETAAHGSGTELRAVRKMAKKSADESRVCFEGKSLLDPMQKIQKRVANKIDSAMVSSILKETNVVDLQRQVLIYLVENAVLHTKMDELEQVISSKAVEDNKVENTLKDETRLLMMENRELRITLDEQKLETNTLRSKVMMLERVLQSVSTENRELTYQLGEFLGIQNSSKKELSKLSSSYPFGNQTTSKVTRRSSLPTQFSNQNETHLNYSKSKLLSNVSNFLDATVEESSHQWSNVSAPSTSRGGPMQASTPLAPFTRLRDAKMGINNASLNASNIQSVKRRFKPLEKDNSVHSRNLEAPSESDTPESCVKNLRFHPSPNLDESPAKFPFNSILEKLKANSDYRLSRRSSLLPPSEDQFGNDRVSPSATSVNPKSAMSDREAAVSSQDSQLKSVVAGRKGKNIHQRIQNILDRIVYESEEAAS